MRPAHYGFFLSWTSIEGSKEFDRVNEHLGLVGLGPRLNNMFKVIFLHSVASGTLLTRECLCCSAALITSVVSQFVGPLKNHYSIQGQEMFCEIYVGILAPTSRGTSRGTLRGTSRGI